MQFIVFAAFAMVLSVPDNGPPWTTFGSGVIAWLIVGVQVAFPVGVAAVYARQVKMVLDREPAWLPAAQRKLARAGANVRTALAVGLAASLYLTEWSVMVRHWRWTSAVYGCDELVMLSPFFAAMILSWIALYPADKAVRRVSLELQLWASNPVHPIWRLPTYLSFMLRHHVLIIFIPMVPIVMANDFVHVRGAAIRRFVGVAWADQAVLVAVAGLVFLIAPVLLRFVWHTRPLPPGHLRNRLDGLCKRIGLAYRQILIWESDGMVVNAAVMGLFRPVRYILLSDGLLEMMDDDKIEAVFGHEAGHVKHRHIQFYLLFAILSMLIVGGATELAIWQWPGLLRGQSMAQDYLQVAAMAMIVFVWAFGFGYVSRRFEWQADLFGAKSVTPPAERCDHPCLYHQTAEFVSPDPVPVCEPICATGTAVFADALERIAFLNGIPAEAKSWRHSSIAHRVRMLRSYAQDPSKAARLQRTVLIIKIVLQVGVFIGLGMGLWLYWPAS